MLFSALFLQGWNFLKWIYFLLEKGFWLLGLWMHLLLVVVFYLHMSLLLLWMINYAHFAWKHAMVTLLYALSALMFITLANSWGRSTDHFYHCTSFYTHTQRYCFYNVSWSCKFSDLTFIGLETTPSISWLRWNISAVEIV